MSILFYWRLSAFYLFYFAALGVIVPYWPDYLRSLAFNSAQIGELMAIIMSTRVIAPYLWGWLADHTGRRMAIVRITSFLALLGFLGVFLGQDFWWLALVMSVFSFFWNAALPLFEATTLAHLDRDSHRYSHIRLWGSIGFILSVVILGQLLEIYPQVLIVWTIALLFTGLWIASLFVPERRIGHSPHPTQPILKILRQPPVIALFSACFLMQFSHGGYYTFYTIYLLENEYARSLAGYMWALGVVAEIMVFLFMHRILNRFGWRELFMLSLLLAALRWLLIGHFADTPTILLFAQLFHAASFGVHHAVSMQFIYHYFPGRLQGRGQALYSILSFGAGNALGSLISGYTWDFPGATATFELSSLACLLGLWISWRWLENG